MAEPEQVREGIWRLVAPNPGPMTLEGTNTWVVDTGEEGIWVIDPGPGMGEHIAAVRSLGERLGEPTAALLTHSHLDHGAAVEALGLPLRWGRPQGEDEATALMAVDLDAPLIQRGDVQRAQGDRGGAAGTGREAEDPGGDIPAGAADTGREAEDVGGGISKDPSAGGERDTGREAEDPGGGISIPFSVLPTPGHAADHVAFVRDDVCFCGDLILGTGSSIVPPRAAGGSLADYMDSLDRVEALGAACLLPGHGPPITAPAAKIAEYREHRRDRERRLLAALERGERSRTVLLAEVWDDVPEPLRPAAALAMRAHLEKLAAEGVELGGLQA